MSVRPTDQLSLVVDQDRRLNAAFLNGSSPIRWGELRLGGALRVRRDLQSGDELKIIVHDERGEVVAGGTATVETPSFPLIKEEGKVVGVKRCVSIALTENDLFAPRVETTVQVRVAGRAEGEGGSA